MDDEMWNLNTINILCYDLVTNSTKMRDLLEIIELNWKKLFIWFGYPASQLLKKCILKYIAQHTMIDHLINTIF